MSDAVPAGERRRRRREVVVILLMALVLGGFALFETQLPAFSDSGSLAGNVVFFLLINLNLILLVLMAFLVFRNFVKLGLERRRGILGSRLRTRLVLAFVGLTLFPTILLFVVAEGFLTQAFDNWFSVRVESSLQGALRIAETVYQHAGNSAVQAAGVVRTQAERRRLLRVDRVAELQAFLEVKRAEFGLAGVAALAPSGEVIAAASAEDFDVRRLPPSAEFLAGIRRGETAVTTEPLGGIDIVRGGVPVGGPAGRAIGAILVDYPIGRSVSAQARDIGRSVQEFRQLGVLQRPMKNSYILTFALITLVVVFAATWVGFRLAGGITVPLQRLAEGTREVAQGNLDHRIEAGGDEELAPLVDSFNRMTGDLKAGNSQLEERRRYIETVLANVTAGVVSVGGAGAVTTVNPAAAGMLGLDAGAVRGQPWEEVFGRPDLRDVGEMIAEVAGGREDAVERQVKLSGGQRVMTALVTTTVLRDEAGTSLGTMVFFEDVSHVLRVERMEAWREVARRIAHEIKNPLTPIQLSVQRLRKRYRAVIEAKGGGVFDECTDTIIRQVEELKHLVNEFSSFARLPPVDMALHDLNAVIHEALVLFREGHRDVEFAFAPESGLPPVEIDREAVKRVVINLLDNAVAACHSVPDGGTGRIEVSASYRERLGIVQLEVADNGTGIPGEVRGRLFEPYVSTKKDGTGLGLAIVSAIAADHQAYVRVRDNEPRGSRFIIEFPLRRRQDALRALRA